MTKRPNILLLLYPFFILIIYILTVDTSVMKYEWDAVRITSWADKGLYIVPAAYNYTAQQHHMLLTTLNTTWCGIWKFFGYNGSCLMPLRFLSCIFGAAGAAGFFILLHKIFERVTIALFGSLGLAFSIYYWAFSTNVETHIFPVSVFIYCLVLSFHLEKFEIKKVILLGFLHSICMFFTSVYIFFMPAIIVAMIINISNREVLYKALLWYLFSFLLFWAVPFFIIGLYSYKVSSGLRYSDGVMEHMFIWCRGFEPLIPFRWVNLLNARIPYCYFSAVHYINRCDGPTIFLGFIAIILYVPFFLAFLINYKDILKKFLKLVLIIFSIIIPYQFILLIYEPFNAERYIHFLPALWMSMSFLAYPLFAGRLKPLRLLPFVLICFIFFTNLLFYIYLRHLGSTR